MLNCYLVTAWQNLLKSKVYSHATFIFSLIFLQAVTVGTVQGQYGSNGSAGSFLNVGDARIYYEVYGSGEPVVLLHGGLFGYIDDYTDLIPRLSATHKVILIATRGHGKSEVGTREFSYALFAEDTYKVIRKITTDSVTVIGFSDGAIQGYLLAMTHPEAVKRLVAIAGNWGAKDFSGDDKQFIDNLNGDFMIKNFPDFVKERQTLMPDPQRFTEFVNKLATVWRQPVYVTPDDISRISCPTMVVAGQNDGCPIEKYVEIYRQLQHGQIFIVPDSDHLVLMRRPRLVGDIILEFIK
jgi:pimeloyl-ACP methyl ester carboxylesterase